MTLTASAQAGAVRPHWRYRARQLAWAGIDLIYPPDCGGCDRPGVRLCETCRSAFRRLTPPVCAVCGYPARPSRPCGWCRSSAHGLQPLVGLRSAAFFGGPLQKALHRLKYSRDLALADDLAVELARAWQVFALPADLVAPVPLSAPRQRERGYNQAGLLARAFAELCGLPFQPEAAERVRDTASQVGLSAEARRANVQGAFVADRQLAAGQRVLLVDDVCTTGATLAACGEALATAGAAEIWGLTLARAASWPRRRRAV